MSCILRTRLDDPMRLANSTTAILQPLDREAPIRVGTPDDVGGGTIARQRALSILVVALRRNSWIPCLGPVRLNMHFYES
jgi:hypothetical protein